MDWELIFYIIAAIIFVITSAFRGKKKYEQESPLMEEQEKEENQYWQQMMEQDEDKDEESREAWSKNQEKTSEWEAYKKITDSVPDRNDQDKEIQVVREDLNKKRRTILDLRKAVIYQSILNRKYF